MSNMPQMAKTETIMFRYIRRFHENFVARLGGDTKETLRCAAWQLDEFLQEHGKYKDADFLKTILATIEYVVQKKGNTKWTVERAKKDLRGRTRGVNQSCDKVTRKKRPPVPIQLSKAIEARLVEVPKP